jgi:hypothetical protein
MLASILDLELAGLDDEPGSDRTSLAAAVYADVHRGSALVSIPVDLTLTLTAAATHALVLTGATSQQSRARAWAALARTPLGRPVRQAVRGLALVRLAGTRGPRG